MYTPKSSKFASAAASIMAAFVMTFTAVGPAPESALSASSAKAPIMASAAAAPCHLEAAFDCSPIRA